MIFYHGTNQENWKHIQEEGILFGKLYVNDKLISRCTYLATDLNEAKCYGDVILEVEYNPFKRKKKNNYIEGCWQFRVYEPIPIQNVRKI